MRNVLVLYHGQSMFTQTVRDYVESFGKYSCNNIAYLHCCHDTETTVDFDDFDVIMMMYSCRLCYLELMSPVIRQKLRDCRRLKVAFAQDEYQEADKVKSALLELGFRILFTCVPEEKISWVYPPDVLPGLRAVNVLTGYVPDRLCGISRADVPKMENRPYWIGHRGRNIGHCWGDLAYHKAEIGKRFKEAADRRNIPTNIDWTEQARIYHHQWFGFISSCRTTLATPSGTNIFDWDGSIEREYKKRIAENPALSYEEFRPLIAEKEKEINMGQVSPRIFEAVAMGTVIVALEGSYSGVVTPGVDAISVKLDYSNIDDVLDQLADVRHLQNLADAAYKNIIASDRWSYRNFVRRVDAEIDAVDRADRKLQGLPQRTVSEAGYFKNYSPADRRTLENNARRSQHQDALSICLDVSWLAAITPEPPPPVVAPEAIAASEPTDSVNEVAAESSQTSAGTVAAASVDSVHTPRDPFCLPPTAANPISSAIIRRVKKIAPAPVKRYLKTLLISALNDA